jgi:hypothetical protein
VHRLSTDPAFATVKVLRVDFDSSKDLLRQWRVAYQSMLIASKGRSERQRATGETAVGALRKIFEAAR